MLVMVSIIGFAVINLPPGDFMDAYIARMQSSGSEVDLEMADNLRRNYGLDKPIYVQYLIRFSGVLRGDFGWSFDFQEPVSGLINERIALTLVISLCTLIFTYLAAVPIGIVSAVKQYSLTDYTVTLFGFIRAGDPQLPARPAVDVLRVPVLRRRRRRSVLRRVHQRALVPGQAAGPAASTSGCR